VTKRMWCDGSVWSWSLLGHSLERESNSMHDPRCCLAATTLYEWSVKLVSKYISHGVERRNGVV
jgi:hypothetical protein